MEAKTLSELVNLRGKRALVCGASAGIGRATAEILAAGGCQILALARQEAALTELLRGLPNSGHEAIVADLADGENLLARLDPHLKKDGVDILINNCGGPPGGPILEAKPADFARAFQMHVLSAQLLAQRLVPGMKNKGYGRVINVISTSVKAPIANLGVSNTVRAAMASWAKTLSMEVASAGITVNSILPGYTKTDRLQKLLEAQAVRVSKSVQQVAEEWEAMIPARRFAEPSEIAAVIAFLVSPAAGYVNGVSIPIDGGRTPTI